MIKFSIWLEIISLQLQNYALLVLLLEIFWKRVYCASKRGDLLAELMNYTVLGLFLKDIWWYFLWMSRMARSRYITVGLLDFWICFTCAVPEPLIAKKWFRLLSHQYLDIQNITTSFAVPLIPRYPTYPTHLSSITTHLTFPCWTLRYRHLSAISSSSTVLHSN